VEDEARWTRDAGDPFAAVLLRRQHIVCPTAVFRRSVVENVGAFDPAFNRLGCEDRDLWLRIAEVSRVSYLDELHARYRIHDANMSANSERMWRARRLLADKYARRPRGRPLRRRALAAIDADLGHELAMGAPLRPALAAFARALRRDPLRIDAWKGLLRRLLVGQRQGIVVRR
jgi:GT2 family glycosyltransferase